MYGEEHYECAHAHNNSCSSRILSKFSHGLYTRKELKAFSTLKARILLEAMVMSPATYTTNAST